MKRLTSFLLAVMLALSLMACGSADYPSVPDMISLPLATEELSSVSGFSDVPADAGYAEAVAWCRENGIMSGTAADTFSPDGDLTRAMMAAVLYRAEGEPDVSTTPNFVDAQSGAWYSNAVAWASANGTMQGYGNNTFGVNNPVSREQFATILWRYCGAEDGELPQTPDAGSVSEYARPAVGWAIKHHILTVREDGSFVPHTAATRAEVASALYACLPSRTPHTDTPDPDKPTVYMTTNISPEGLMAVANPQGKIAVKIASGEPGSNYLRPELIGDFVQSFEDAALVECNTIYGRFRTATAMHYQTAKDHGYLDIADFDVMDEDGFMALPVEGGSNITENYVGAHFENYDYFIVLSHFKGHTMAGFGGAIKNASIGIASARGKSNIHGHGFIEAMAEATKSVSDALDGNILFINVMNRLSLDCDCEEDPREPEIHDIGILASFDPVALDQACMDLIYQAEGSENFVAQIERLNAPRTLEHGEEIGLGSRDYQLISIDN